MFLFKAGDDEVVTEISGQQSKGLKYNRYLQEVKSSWKITGTINFDMKRDVYRGKLISAIKKPVPLRRYWFFFFAVGNSSRSLVCR